jgi:hypothetical protein
MSIARYIAGPSDDVGNRGSGSDLKGIERRRP